MYIGYCPVGEEHSQQNVIAGRPYLEGTDMTNVTVPEGVTPEVGGMIIAAPSDFTQEDYVTEEVFQANWVVASLYNFN